MSSHLFLCIAIVLVALVASRSIQDGEYWKILNELGFIGN